VSTGIAVVSVLVNIRHCKYHKTFNFNIASPLQNQPVNSV
jgi:hypothetical protein